LAGQINLKGLDALAAELVKIRNKLLEAETRIELQTPVMEGVQGGQPQTLPPTTPPVQPQEKQKEGIKVSLHLLAKYPFLSAGRPLLKEYNPGNMPPEVYSRASKRILEAIERGERGVTPRLEPPWVELLSFHLARYFITYIDDSWLRMRWALAEAARIERLLINESDEVIIYVINDLGLNVKKETEEGEWSMYGNQYLRLSRRLRPMPDWLLINRRTSRGRVMLMHAEVIKLVKEWLYDIFAQTGAFRAEWGPEELKIIKDVLQGRFAKVVSSTPTKGWPPCMVALRNRVAEIDNYGLAALIFYMVGRGYSKSEIVNVLKLRSDFDEEVAVKQIEYAAIRAGGLTNDEPPSCFDMRMRDLCIDNGIWCLGHIKNPLQYPSSPQTIPEDNQKANFISNGK
jgi:hypothetical protein